MSRIAPFVAGVIVSQAGYVYLSDRVVGDRNRLMIRHLGVTPSNGTYQSELQGTAAEYLRPLVQAVGGSAGSQGAIKGKAGGAVPPYSNVPSQPSEHQLVTDVRKSWNTAVVNGSDWLVGLFYSDNGSKPAATEEGQKKN